MPVIKVDKFTEKKRYTTGTIQKYQHIRVIELKPLAKRIGMPYSTLCERMKKPEMFRLKELQLICDELRIPEEERLPML